MKPSLLRLSSSSALTARRSVRRACRLCALAWLLGVSTLRADSKAYTTTTLRLRETPSESGAVLAIMPTGNSVRVGACANSWCEVTFRSYRGYAAERFLSKTFAEAPAEGGKGYVNSQGVWVPSPAHTPDNQPPAGASAQCRDGTFSFSMSRRGTCSHHGGVAHWL
jgi:uncharacterized protein YraI